jgi:serine/threonine-protein kinase
MKGHGRNWTDIGADQETLEVPSPLLDRSDLVATAAGRPVSLVEGSGPGISAELQALLRWRLRMAALLLFVGFALFLTRSILWGGFALEGPKAVTPQQQQIARATHVIVTLILGLCSIGLCRSCPMSTRLLRWKEILIFGAPAVLFLYLQYLEMTTCARQGFLPNPAAGWLVLIFTYALFIPNTWQRAAGVIGVMAAAPVVSSLYLISTDQTCAVVAGSEGFVVTLALLMTISAIAAVVGVHNIGGLRTQAYEARELGQYRLRQPIGSGGMGEVHLAEHQLLKRPCAIKLIRPEKAGDPRVMARFEREVRSTAKLSHWNNIDVYDYGHTADGTFYYVMEYLPGMNLDELVQRHGPLPPERLIHFLLQTCEALEEAHGIGLVHRDIKPANIFAAHRGGRYDVAKLLDFGLAKPATSSQSTGLTQEGMITGSPLYMSPEQAMGDSEPDARSDIYSLGAVAYYALCGRPPFNHDKPIKVLFAHAQEPPLDLAEAVPGIPTDLSDVVMRCLAKDPAGRYQHVGQLAEALRQCHSAGRWDWSDAAQWWTEVDTQLSVPAPVTV